MSLSSNIRKLMDDRKKIYLIVFAMALIIRILFILFLDNKWYFYDTIHYHTAAKSIVSGNGFGEGIFPAQEGIKAYNLEPIYPLFLAVWYKLFGVNLLAVRIIQAVLFSVIPLFVLIIGEKLFNRNVGLIGTLIAIIYPYLVFLSGFLYPTGLATLIIILFTYISLKFIDDYNIYYLILSSLFIGLMILIIPLTLSFVPFWMIWLWINQKKSVSKKIIYSIISIVMIILVLIPWTIRNYRIYNKIVPIRAATNTIKNIDKAVSSDFINNQIIEGDELKVQISSDENGHHFDCYYNGEYRGRVTDEMKIYGNQSKLYSGIILAPNLNNSIEKFTSKNDSITFSDDFNREVIGDDWNVSSIYRLFENNLIVETENNEWGGLAICKKVINPESVSMKWGKGANNIGLNESAFALMLDSDSLNSNGYMVWRSPFGYLRLWTIKNGKPGKYIQKIEELQLAVKADQSSFQKFVGTMKDSPGAFIKRYCTEFLHFWTPVIDKVRTENRFNTKLTRLIGIVTFSIILIFSLINIFFIKGNQWRESILIIFLILSFAFSYSFFSTQIRYRIPVEPYFIMLAANGFWNFYLKLKKQ